MAEYKELRMGANVSGNRYLLNNGLSYQDELLIGMNYSPHMENMCYDDGGLPITRGGQSHYFSEEWNDVGKVYPDYKGKMIIPRGTSLLAVGSAIDITTIGNIIDPSTFRAFQYNDVLYVLVDNKLYTYDGTTYSEVAPYIPLVTMNSKPDGADTDYNEDINLLTGKMRFGFNGDGTSTVYKLPFKDLDAGVNVVAEVNGTTIEEGSGLTVNRSAGEITFAAAPAAMINYPNNVVITASKTTAGTKDKILKCDKFVEFSNRIFATGNSDYPNMYFASGIGETIDATYFPEKYQYTIRGNDKAVTGFLVWYNKLLVFKEDLIASVEASTGIDNTASFPISFLNTSIGCDIPDSIQMINNYPIFANTEGGIFAIKSTIIADEKNVECISQNINGSLTKGGLLNYDKGLLKEATSIDYDFKYWLSIGDKCFVMDYRGGINVGNPMANVFLFYTNIDAKQFWKFDGKLFRTHRDSDWISYFTDTFNDFGVAIKSVWKTRMFDFESPDYLKTVKEVWLVSQPYATTAYSINYYTDKETDLDGSRARSQALRTFKWAEFTWGNFTWKVHNFPIAAYYKPKLRRIRLCQIEITSEQYNKPLSIINIIFRYKLVKKYKKR